MATDVDDGEGADEPVELPIDGTLDLHTFRPADVGSLVPDYLEACRGRGILQVRIVHGKGTGTLARGVHALLHRLPWVRSFAWGGSGGGDWGATVVQLQPPEGAPPTPGPGGSPR